ncbi:MAG: hypothetical protein AB8B66_00715 [Rickettsiaceae bacterium]
MAPSHIILFCVLNIGYSWFSFHITSKALKLSNKPYSNNNLSKFYRFVKELITINIKIIACTLILGIGAYVAVSTNGLAMTTGEMIISYLLSARALIGADNIVVIWSNMRSSYVSYSNLQRLITTSIL